MTPNPMSEAELSDLERRALTDFLMTEQGETTLKLIADLRAARAEAEQARAAGKREGLEEAADIVGKEAAHVELSVMPLDQRTRDTAAHYMQHLDACRSRILTRAALATPDGQGED